MREAFLHYIWQYQYFDKHNLESEEGEKITVYNSGMPNTDAGPDFLNAKIKIGSIEWSGSVEIHSQSSEWDSHQHGNDPAYENVILHVVWKNNRPIKRKDGTLIPTLSLTNRLDNSLINNYKKLINNPASIPCQNQIPKVDGLVKLTMIDRALALRLQQKSNVVVGLFAENKNDWEETTYQMLARNFGFKINSEAFFSLARSLPLKILLKHYGNLMQIEALLFGQAGLLEKVGGSDYKSKLVREYTILAKKYKLEPKLSKAQWKYLRLRPANFPTIRIAQFASLINSSRNLFSRIIEAENVKSLQRLFSTSTSGFWKSHYQFGKSKTAEVKSLGQDSINNLLINTVIPLWAAYGKHRDAQEYMDRAIYGLQEIKAEKNSITKKWVDIGVEIKSAHDAQALIGQYNDFCKKRMCLNCSVGHTLLRSNTK